MFSRQIFLGEALDTDALEANYANGVLSIKVPVHESAKPRRVPISVTNGSQRAIGSRDRRSKRKRKAVAAGDAA